MKKELTKKILLTIGLALLICVGIWGIIIQIQSISAHLDAINTYIKLENMDSSIRQVKKYIVWNVVKLIYITISQVVFTYLIFKINKKERAL